MAYYVTLWTPSGKEARYPGYDRVETDSLENGVVFPECSDDCVMEADYFRVYFENGIVENEGSIRPPILITKGVAPKIFTIGE